MIVLINDPRPNAISERLSTVSPHRRPDPRMRDYGVGAQILIDLGVRDMMLLSDRAQTLVGLEGYGLNVIDSNRDTYLPVPLRPKLDEVESALSTATTMSEGEIRSGRRDG